MFRTFRATCVQPKVSVLRYVLYLSISYCVGSAPRTVLANSGKLCGCIDKQNVGSCEAHLFHKRKHDPTRHLAPSPNQTQDSP